jgi:hypothetical protein
VQLNTLAIEDVVIHRVPGKNDVGATGPVLSEALSPPDPRVFGFFRQRLSGVMARRGLPVQADVHGIAADAALGIVIAAVDQALVRRADLVSASKLIGQRLWETQDGRNPAGILVVARGQIDGSPCVGLLKLEHERGVQAEATHDGSGNLVFRMILHDDLLLTEGTAVFKGAIFRRRRIDRPGLVGQASDLQNQRDVAGFFLSRFLGCSLVDDPPEATRKYFDAAEDYINSVGDPEKRARYEGALLAQLNSATQTIDPDRFARDNLDASEHQSFLSHLGAAGASTAAFPKNTDRIQGRIRRVAYGFESGIKLVGSPDAMDNHVEISTADGTGTRVTVTDEITKMHGSG